MRQVGDTLVWLGMIVVVAAVIYFTPRLASYVAAAAQTAQVDGCATCEDLPAQSHHAARHAQ
jgi:hypothetical protein